VDRRAFLGTLSLLAAPVAIEAQQAARLPRVGVLIAESPDSATSSVKAFLEGLHELGYLEGENVAIEYRYDYGRGEAVPQVADFIRSNVAVIVAGGGPLALAAKSATQTIPIVFVAAGRPVEFGIVASLARPGGNATGLSLRQRRDCPASGTSTIRICAFRHTTSGGPLRGSKCATSKYGTSQRSTGHLLG